MADKQTGSEQNGVEMLRVTTMDDKTVEVPKETILLCPTVRDLINNLGEENVLMEGVPIAIPGVTAEQLDSVIKWLESHKGKPEYEWPINEITNERTWAKLSAEDKALLDPMSLEQYITLLDASHYLGVESMRWSVTQCVAEKLKDKDVDAIRAYLNEPDDLTDEEKEAIRREDVWANF